MDKTITKEKIIEEIKKVASKIKSDQLSHSIFLSNSNITERQINKFFDSWNQAVEEAGLKPYEKNIKISEEDLFGEMERVFKSFKGICTRLKFNKLSKFSADAYRRRFGCWDDVLRAFRKWLEINKKQFLFINQLPKNNANLSISKETKVQKRIEIGRREIGGRGSSTIYGSFLNFRGLQHAPLNEQGVVFLFGMICSEVGFKVEAVRNNYPDCEAKRRIDKNCDEWEKVMIEFEYYSSNFREHGHDPKKCDLIVCWRHDWQECPLEVIELESLIGSMTK